MSTEPSRYLAVLLIAGAGRRMIPLTYKTSKCLLKIGDGKNMLDIQLDALNEAGIKEAILVVGYYGWKIREMYGSSYKGMKLRYFTNPFYNVTGGAHSLWLVRNAFKGHYTIIMDGDHVLGAELIKKLINTPYKNCILCDPDSKDLNEDTQVTGQNGLVKYLAWSQDGKLHKHVNPDNCVGEALIIVKLSPNASSILKDEIDRHVRDGAGILEVITPLNNLFRRVDCSYVFTEKMPWIEVDFPSDLRKAIKEIYPRVKRNKIGGENTK